MTRSKALLIVVPLAIGIGALLLLPLLLDKETVLELATSTLEEQTGASLTVAGDSSLSFFPGLEVTLGDTRLAMPGEGQPRLQVRSLDLGLALLPLLSGRAEVNSLALDGLTISMVSAARPTIDTGDMSDAELDAFYSKRRQATAEAVTAAGAEAALALPLALNVQQLTINDARIEQTDSATQISSVIELPGLNAQNLNLDGEPIALDAALKLPGASPLDISLEGTIRIYQASQTVTLDKLNVIISGATAQAITLEIRGDIDISRQVADLTLTLVTGETRGEGSLRYASFESPRIDSKMAFNMLNPALLALAGPEAAAHADSESAAADGDAPLPLDAIRAIDTRAELAVERAVFDAHTVSNLRAVLRVVDGVIKLRSLTGTLHDGNLDMQATFNARHNTASIKTKGQLNELDIASALAATEAQPAFSGKASLDWQVAGKGRTRNELVAALTGPMKLTTSQLLLNDISVEHLLCQAVALTNQEPLTATFPTSTSFETLGADIQLAEGKARLRPLRAKLAHITLTGRGGLDLLSNDFKATFKARLSPELETLDRACRVSKRLTAIAWPVDCKGNTSGDPAGWCKVDTAEIIEDLGKNEATRKIQKEAGKLLDKLFN